MRGFMFKKYEMPLIFIFKKETYISIHMLFVFFSIDLIYLDKNKKVIELKKKVKPFIGGYFPKKKAKYLIEIKKGEILKKNIEMGDILEF
jgi:uncharacterized membrane protein (UPF0127 family)